MQYPLFTYFANTTMESTPIMSVAIQMNDPDDQTTIDNLAKDLSAVADGLYDLNKAGQIDVITDKIRTILNRVFYGLIGITMFLCFFSLSASMSANLYE